MEVTPCTVRIEFRYWPLVTFGVEVENGVNLRQICERFGGLEITKKLKMPNRRGRVLVYRLIAGLIFRVALV